MAECSAAGKTAYASHGEAAKAIESLARRGQCRRVRLHVYRCPDCGKFHLTKRDRGEWRRIVRDVPR